ncbi:MAG: ParB/RepB/Spo0J family partition protein [Psychroflexus sp.]|nr:ParB/RepB/Spo0J family partition protein [Psychroflexus sp.]
MAKKGQKKALGRGLSALLNDPENDIKSAEDENAKKVVGNIVELALDSIEVNPFQPRTSFSEESLQELASSIKELGVIQPITVRKVDVNKFQLVSGERRFRASKIAGIERIPAFVRIANDQETLEMALVENIQRQDLDPIEIALSYQRLIDEVQLTQESLSERVGKKRSTIANYLRLLKLDPIIQTGMRDSLLSMGHGRALVNIEDHQIQLDIYERIIKHKLSVRATEKIIQEYKNPSAKGKDKHQLTNDQKRAQKELKDSLGAKIAIQSTRKGNGKIIIPFSSEEDFKRLEKLLTKDD